MGINSYGLFGSNQNGSSYNSRNYELQRQLEARQHQLDDLDKMPSLSAAQQEKRKQLLHAVDHLSDRLDARSSQSKATDQTAGLNGIGRRELEDGIVIRKPRIDAANAYSRMTPQNKRPQPGYADNEYSNSGSVTYKNPGRYDGTATTPGDTYLKGFFVDIKL